MWSAGAHLVVRDPALGRQHECVCLLVTGFISFDYFFLVSASDGRMDMMCASLRLRPSQFTSPFESRTSPPLCFGVPGSCLRAHSPHGSNLLVRPGFLMLYQDRRLLSWRLWPLRRCRMLSARSAGAPTSCRLQRRFAPSLAEISCNPLR